MMQGQSQLTSGDNSGLERRLRGVYVSRHSPVRAPTDPYFGLPCFFARQTQLFGVWGANERRERPSFAGACVSSHELPTSFFCALLMALTLLGSIWRYRPHFIVCTVEEPALLLGWLASRITRCSLWVAVQDPPFSLRYRENQGLRWRIEQRLCTRLIRRLLGAATGVVGFIRRDIVDDFLPGDTHYVELGAGISETGDSLSGKLEWPDPPPGSAIRLGFVGAIDEEQGIPELLAATALARRKLPDLQVSLIGPLEAGWASGFEALLARYDLAGAVEVTGWLPYPKMLAAMRRCHFGCYPRRASPWSQAALPPKIFEYLTVGRSVIAWNYPGAKSVLRGGDYGVLVPAGDVEALAEAIYELASRERRAALEANILAGRPGLLARPVYERVYREIVARL